MVSQQINERQNKSETKKDDADSAIARHSNKRAELFDAAKFHSPRTRA